MPITTEIAAWLDEKAALYERPEFVANDPIQVPHQFQKLQDKELAAFFATAIAWGNRKIIIRNARRLMTLMDNAPHDFILQHTPADLQRLEGFVHRTFQPQDLRYCIRFFRDFYAQNESLETAFTAHLKPDSLDITDALKGFHDLFFSLPNPSERTRKHIATPAKKSACKRLCMLLRWLVRPADRGVELGIWKNIRPSQLIIPLDVHVARVARHFGLLHRPADDWQSAILLTEQLRLLDPADPVRYDFALFGAGEDLGKAAFS